MKVKIFSLITALSICFSSLIFPFYSVSALAQQAVIPWVEIFRFIGESLGAWAISKGAEHAVDQLTGSGRKMTDDEYNATSQDWDACVSYMKSQGCTDSDIENLQAQIQGGDLDLSSKVGKALQDYFAQKGANISGQWDYAIDHSVLYPHAGLLSKSYIMRFVDSIGESNRGKHYLTNKYYNITSSYNLENRAIALVPYTRSDVYNYTYIAVFGYSSLDSSKSLNCNWHNMIGYFIVTILGSGNWRYDYFDDSDANFSIDSATSIFSGYPNNDNLDSVGLKSDIKIPNNISAYGGSVPHYYNNTIDNDDSSLNTYNNVPASIDWSKIFDMDDDKNPTFKKIDGYTPPEPKIKDDGSNYDDVVKQLQEANKKLAKILGWLEDFDYDNNGKIKDRRLSPIETNSPLFNFKLSEKFPFSLPWDMLAILSILKASPVAPKYEFPIMMPDETGKVKRIKLSDDRIGVIQGDKIVIDFTSQDWQDTAKILRWGELVLFICGLCVVFWKYGK